MKQKNKPDNQTIKEDIRQLVLARVRALPKDVKLAIGSNDYTKDELLKNIGKDSEVGREVIAIQMEYLRDLASGAIYAGQQ